MPSQSQIIHSSYLNDMSKMYLIGLKLHILIFVDHVNDQNQISRESHLEVIEFTYLNRKIFPLSASWERQSGPLEIDTSLIHNKLVNIIERLRNTRLKM